MTSTTFVTVLGHVIIVGSVLAVLENLLVIVVLAKTKQLCIKYFAFVFHLALTDFMFAAMIVVFIPVKARVLSGVLQVYLFTSMLTILAVAVNRYLALTLSPPSRYDALATPCHMVMACLLLWCISLALHVPVMLAASGELKSILSAWLRAPLVLVVWLVTAVVYLLVFRKIRSYTPPLASSPGVRTPNQEQATTRARQTRRLMITFGIILVMSLFCWIPYNVCQIIQYFLITGQSEIQGSTFENYQWFSVSVYCLSPAINPLIYWWRLDGFRQGFKALICPCLPRQNGEVEETVVVSEIELKTKTVEDKKELKIFQVEV